jgi:hypothetical protein
MIRSTSSDVSTPRRPASRKRLSPMVNRFASDSISLFYDSEADVE